MKIAELLNEGIQEVSLSDNASTLYSQYSDAINILLDVYQDSGRAEDYMLFKGMDLEAESPFIMTPIEDRKPAYAQTKIYHYAFKTFKPWTKLSPRSVIGTTDLDEASEYGAEFILLPINGTTLHVLPNHDLWKSFDRTGKKVFGQSVSLVSQLKIVDELATAVLGHDADWSNMKNTLKELDRAIRDDPEHWTVVSDYFRRHISTDYIEQHGFSKAFQAYFNIAKDITTTDINGLQEFSGMEREVWYYANSLVLPLDSFETFCNHFLDMELT